MSVNGPRRATRPPGWATDAVTGVAAHGIFVRRQGLSGPGEHRNPTTTLSRDGHPHSARMVVCE